MSESKFKPGDIVEHVHFKGYQLFVVMVHSEGIIGCRYESYHRNSDSYSEKMMHYGDFEPFELKPFETKEDEPLGFFIS